MSLKTFILFGILAGAVVECRMWMLPSIPGIGTRNQQPASSGDYLPLVQRDVEGQRPPATETRESIGHLLGSCFILQRSHCLHVRKSTHSYPTLRRAAQQQALRTWMHDYMFQFAACNGPLLAVTLVTMGYIIPPQDKTDRNNKYYCIEIMFLVVNALLCFMSSSVCQAMCCKCYQATCCRRSDNELSDDSE